MVAGSHLIVHGTVSGVRSQLTTDRRSIETLVTLTVAETIKGAAAPQVAFRVPGGQVGRYRRVLVGAPQFSQGDEVILFLAGRSPALPMPFGLSQGVYRVQRTAQTTLVTPLITPAAGRVVRGDPSRRPLTVAAFEAQVRAVMP